MFVICCQSNPPHGPPKLAVLTLGAAFFVPTFVWFKFLCCISKEEKEKRKIMHEKRRERREEQYRLMREERAQKMKELAEKEEAAQRERDMDKGLPPRSSTAGRPSISSNDDRKKTVSFNV